MNIVQFTDEEGNIRYRDLDNDESPILSEPEAREYEASLVPATFDYNQNPGTDPGVNFYGTAPAVVPNVYDFYHNRWGNTPLAGAWVQIGDTNYSRIGEHGPSSVYMGYNVHPVWDSVNGWRITQAQLEYVVAKINSYGFIDNLLSMAPIILAGAFLSAALAPVFTGASAAEGAAFVDQGVALLEAGQIELGSSMIAEGASTLAAEAAAAGDFALSQSITQYADLLENIYSIDGTFAADSITQNLQTVGQSFIDSAGAPVDDFFDWTEISDIVDSGDLTDLGSTLDQVDFQNLTDVQLDEITDSLIEPPAEFQGTPEEAFENATIEQDWGELPEFTDDQLLEQFATEQADLAQVKPEQLKDLARLRQAEGVTTSSGSVLTYAKDALGLLKSLRDVYLQWNRTATPAQVRALASRTGLPAGVYIGADGKLRATAVPGTNIAGTSTFGNFFANIPTPYLWAAGGVAAILLLKR